jgi:hypothetical protein
VSVIQPDLKWYTEISVAKKLSPRCPFASVHRCPRYYESIALLGDVGVATSMDPTEDERLLNKWKHSDLWPVTHCSIRLLERPGSHGYCQERGDARLVRRDGSGAAHRCG